MRRSDETGSAELAASFALLAILGIPVEWLALIIGLTGVVLGGLGLRRMHVVVGKFDELNATLQREVSAPLPVRPDSEAD